MAQNEYAVRLEHVTKTFGPVVANKDVSWACAAARFWPCWAKTAAARRP